MARQRSVSGRWLEVPCLLASLLLAVLLALSGLPDGGRSPGGTARASDEGQAKPPKPAPKLTRSWTVLHAPQRNATGPLPQRSPLEPLLELDFDGPHPEHPFLLGQFRANGDWSLANGVLRPEADRDAALRLARAENFELEGIVDASGRGGWFLLLGWDNGHGYAVYNVEMLESGSVWHISEFRNAKGIEGTDAEIHRYYWRGPRALRLSVVDRKLTLRADREAIAQDLELPNYHEGDVILGAYQTRYGPKPLKVQSLRIRAR